MHANPAKKEKGYPQTLNKSPLQIVTYFPIFVTLLLKTFSTAPTRKTNPTQKQPIVRVTQKHLSTTSTSGQTKKANRNKRRAQTS